MAAAAASVLVSAAAFWSGMALLPAGCWHWLGTVEVPAGPLASCDATGSVRLGPMWGLGFRVRVWGSGFRV